MEPGGEAEKGVAQGREEVHDKRTGRVEKMRRRRVDEEQGGEEDRGVGEERGEEEDEWRGLMRGLQPFW